MPFGIWIRLGPKNRVLDEGPDPKRPHLFHFIFFIFLLLITFVISVSIMIVDLSTTNISHILSTVLLLDQASIDNRKKNCQNSNTSPTRFYNMVNFSLLAAVIVSLVCGTPANFNGFRVLAELLHGSGRQRNFAALNRGRHLCSAGRPSRWALAHILVLSSSSSFFLSSPNLSRRRLDICHTSTHGVALVRI